MSLILHGYYVTTTAPHLSASFTLRQRRAPPGIIGRAHKSNASYGIRRCRRRAAANTVRALVVFGFAAGRPGIFENPPHVVWNVDFAIR